MRFNFSDQIDRTTCKESVLLRDTFNTRLKDFGSDFVALKCQTEKVCFSVSGEDCSDQNMVSTDQNKVRVVKLSKSPDKAKEIILDKIAESWFGCHTQLGEGNLNYLPTDWKSKTYCSLCSRFVYEESSVEIVSDIYFKDLYKVLEEKKDDKGGSYLYRIFKVEDADYFKEQFYRLKADGKIVTNLEYDDLKYPTSYKGGYVILSRMFKGGKFADIASWLLDDSPEDSLYKEMMGELKELGYNEEKGFLYLEPEFVPYKLSTFERYGCGSFEFAA